MQFYNTLTRKKEEFKSIEPNKVIMYVCGLTPYDHMHMGHARTYIAFDVLRRFLIKKGYYVMYIQNVTDVEDKIINRAREIGANPLKLARKYQTEAEQLLQKLGVLPAYAFPYVSEHIPEIINMVDALIKNGYGYKTSDGIYYRVRKFKDYGKLSGQDIDKIRSGARVTVNEDKEEPIDFALWKFKDKDDYPSFESPWGWGRPGWHIECSAMSLKYSNGRTLDIHGGARDLIFPHHENEIAQSEGATGKKFVNYWMHTGYLTVNGEKMSKSLGNFVTLLDALKIFSPEAIRYFFSIVHYRSPVDYDEQSLKEAQKSVDKIRNVYIRLNEKLEEYNKIYNKTGGETEDKTTPADATETNKNIQQILLRFKNEFYAHMENDLDTPSANATLMSFIKYVNANIDSFSSQNLTLAIQILKEITYIFGLDFMLNNLENKIDDILLSLSNSIISIMDDYKQYGLSPDKSNSVESVKSNINKLIELRTTFREQKNWKKSDEIRDKLNKIGIILSDSSGKTTYDIKRNN